MIVASGLVLATLTVLTGCNQFVSYKQPTSGAIARVRAMGNQPKMTTIDCSRSEEKPDGFLFWGNKKHDLGMPKPPGFSGEYTEYYAVAEKPLVINFADPQPMVAPGLRVVYTGPRCDSVVTRFVPKAGHDYEVRENAYGACKSGIFELVSNGTSGVRYLDVPPISGDVCPQ